jgi:hypothetical protein
MCKNWQKQYLARRKKKNLSLETQHYIKAPTEINNNNNNNDKTVNNN